MTSVDPFTKANAVYRHATRHPFKSGSGFQTFAKPSLFARLFGWLSR